MTSTLAHLLVKIGANTDALVAGLQGAQKQVEGFAGKVKSMLADVAGFQKAEGQVEGFAGKLKGMLGEALPSLTLAGVGMAAIHAAEKFEESFARIARTTGASGERLEAFSRSFREIYKNSAASAEQVSTAIGLIAARTGATGKVLEDLTVKMLRLARAAGVDVGEMVPIVTRVFGDWFIATDRQSAAMDFLLAISQRTGVAINRIGELVVFYGAPLREMGFNFQQAAALMAKFEREGVNTETVLATLRRAISRMAREGVENTAEAFRILVQRIKEAGDTAEARKLALKTFGDRGGVDMLRSIKEGRWDEFLTGEFDKATEATAKAGGEIETFHKRLEKLKHQVELAIAPIGEGLIKTLGLLFTIAKPGIELLGELAKALELITDRAEKAGAALAKVAPPALLEALATGGLWGLRPLGRVMRRGAERLGVPPTLAPSAEEAAAAPEAQSTAVREVEQAIQDAAKATTEWNEGLERAQKALAAFGIHERANIAALTAAMSELNAAYSRGQVTEEAYTEAKRALIGAEMQRTITAIEEGIAEHEAAVEIEAARMATLEYARAQTDAMITAQNFDALVAQLGEEIRKVRLAELDLARDPALVQHWELLGAAAKNAADALSEAFATVGIKTAGETKRTAAEYQAAYERIRDSGIATAREVLEARIKAERAAILLAQESGAAVSEERKRALAAAQEALDVLTGTMPARVARVQGSWDRMFENLRRGWDSIVSGVSRGIADIIVRGENMREVFKRIIQDIASTIISVLIEGAIRRLIDALGLTATGLSRAASTAMTAAQEAASTAGRPAGAAGAAGGGVMGAIGAVSAAVGAIFSGLSYFQGRRTEQDIARIEVTSRGIFAELSNFRVDAWTRHTSLFVKLDDIWRSILVKFDMIGQRLGGGVGAASNTININISGTYSDPRAQAQAIIRELRLLSPAFA